MTNHTDPAAVPSGDGDPTPEAPLVEEVTESTPAPVDFAAMLAAEAEATTDAETRGDEAPAEIEGAGVLLQTMRTARATVEAVQARGLEPDSLPQRVALLDMLLDNTGSMSKLIAMALMGHDHCLDTLQKVTAKEAAAVLASASWLNNPDPFSYSAGENYCIYPYTLLADAPRFRGKSVRLTGATPLYRRFIQQVTAFLLQIKQLEGANKTVFGMIGFITDGMDNDSTGQHTPEKVASVVRRLRRMKTVVPFCMYVGKLPKPDEWDYETERGRALFILRLMGVDTDDPREELEGLDVEGLVRRQYTLLGFDPSVVFMPGADPRAIAAAFVSASKLMESVSRGQMPETASV